MREMITKLERVLTSVLLVLIAVVVILSVVELAWRLVKDLHSPQAFLLNPDEILDLFGAFLLVIIGVELLESLKVYLDEHAVRAEVILLVALIALARKVIVLDVKTVSSVTLLGSASLLAALGLTYRFIRESRHHGGDAQPG